MNTSYNYTDFIGLNLEANNPNETGVENKIKPQSKLPVLSDKSSRHKDEFSKDKSAE